jgi:CHAD domain-containing protein
MPGSRTSFSKSISAYHAGCWQQVHTHLHKLAKNLDEDTIHKARTDTKKLLALYEFIAYCDKDFDCKKSLKPLLRIYKQLGKLRDHSNALSLCLEYKTGQEALDKDKKKLSPLRKKIKSGIEKHKKDFKKREKATEPYLAHISPYQWKKYLRDQLADSAAVLAAKPRARELHDLRKAVKSLHYNLGIADSRAQQAIDGSTASTLDKLQGDIGQWHDLLTFRHRLRAAGYDSSQPGIYTSLLQAELQMKRSIFAHSL